MQTKHWILVAGVLLGCASGSSKKDSSGEFPAEGLPFQDPEFLQRASQELPCPEQQVSLRRWSEHVQAVGCERYVTYYNSKARGWESWKVGTLAPGQQPPLVWSESMTRPKLISGRDPIYTPEALAAHVEGLIIVRCIITTSGTIENCVVIKSLPLMDQPVLDALASRRYEPPLLHGRPVSTYFVFNIKLLQPANAPAKAAP